ANGVPLPPLVELVADLDPPASGDDDVRLFLLLVAVADRRPEVRGEPLVAHAGALGLEGRAREPRLDVRRQPELDGGVLELLQVRDRVTAHAAILRALRRSRSRRAGSARPPGERRGACPGSASC